MQAENLGAVSNKTIVALLQTHLPILCFVIPGLGMCTPHFSFPAGSWLSSPNRGLRGSLEGWMKEKEVVLSCLLSLSVSITQAAVPGPVSNFFCIRGTSLIVPLRAISRVADAHFQKSQYELQSIPTPRFCVPTTPTLFFCSPSSSSGNCFLQCYLAQCDFVHPSCLYCPPVTINPILYIK